MSASPAAPATLEDPRDAIPRLLARRGYRITGPRRAVLEALASSQEPRTVSQLHRALGVERVNLVSVYRTVKLLCDVGLVRATDAAQGQRRYELAEPFTAHHPQGPPAAARSNRRQHPVSLMQPANRRADVRTT